MLYYFTKKKLPFTIGTAHVPRMLYRCIMLSKAWGGVITFKIQDRKGNKVQRINWVVLYKSKADPFESWVISPENEDGCIRAVAKCVKV